MAYPSWSYFPRNARPPDWAYGLAAVTREVQEIIDTTQREDLHLDRKSDAVLARLRPGLESLGFQVESGKSAAERISRPVLFGSEGQPDVTYDIDAFHDEHGIAVEVEAGRGAANGADYRDIVRTSLLFDADYLVLFMPLEYHFKLKGQPKQMLAYRSTLRQLDAIFASRRLQLPFQGLMLIGY